MLCLWNRRCSSTRFHRARRIAAIGVEIAKFHFWTSWSFAFFFLIIIKNESLEVFFSHPYQCFLCRAADWNLNEPTWNGRMRMVSSGAQLNIKLEDKMSGQLFANCPVEAYPGVAIEPVSDSSRYFVLRIQDDNGRSAFIGVGFGVSLLFTRAMMTNVFLSSVYIAFCRIDLIRSTSTSRFKIISNMLKMRRLSRKKRMSRNLNWISDLRKEKQSKSTWK